jgi:hypothetical protein
VPASINDLAALTPATAVTLVVPTERHGDNRAFDSHLTRMLPQVSTELTDRLGKRVADAIVDRIRYELAGIDRAQLGDGLWLGVADGAMFVHHLDDPVTASVRVGDTLDLLPLARQARRHDAIVLTVSEPGADLLRYRAGAPTDTERLRSLRADGFPVAFGGEGGRQARDAGSRQRDDRYRQWLRRVATRVAAAVARTPAAADLPLVVVGVDRYLGFFTEVASGFRVDAVVSASPDALTQAELVRQVTEAVEALYDDAAVAALGRICRSVGSGRAATDLAEIAAWAAQGKVDVLVVDDDVTDDDMAGVVVDVLAHAGTVLTAPPGSVADQLPQLGQPRWAARLRW